MRVMYDYFKSRLCYRYCSINRRRAFTLIELLVVMGVIIILLGITIVAVAAIARDASMKSGVNRVKSALITTRALAMKSNKPTGLIFRVSLHTDGRRQQTELVTVQFSGEAMPGVDVMDNDIVVNRFLTAKNVEQLVLPAGVKVAGPFYAGTEFGDFEDEVWVTQPQFPNTYPQGGNGEFPGRLIGVMFDSDGSLITSIPQTDANARFLDMDDIRDGNGWPVQNFGNTSGNYPQQYYDEDRYDINDPTLFDEPNIYWVPFLTVYNDDEAREFYGDQDWNDPQRYFEELTNGDAFNNSTPTLGYIAEFGTRIHFNRYTGVALK